MPNAIQLTLRRAFDTRPPELHPVRELPDLTTAQRYEWLREHLAMLYDQVWWLSLPWYKRLGWRVLGFSAPISDFYERED